MSYLYGLDKADKSTLLFQKAVETVTAANPQAKECIDKRSEDPFDYASLISSTMEYIGKNTMRKFAEADKLLTREKSTAEARNWRNKGNILFVSHKDFENLGEAFECFTKSIAYAVPNSKDLAESYAYRATVLLVMNRPKESLEDIERALNSNYPKESVPKLYNLRAECLSTLSKHSYIQAKFWLNKVAANDPNLKKMKRDLKRYSAAEYETTIDKLPILPKLKSPHSKFPCISDAIEVVYSGPAGRKIIATRDIDVGEVLIVEKPYMSYCYEGLNYCYCYHCFESCWAGIPCDSCVTTVFCSEKCKSSAWKEYHELECPVRNCLLRHKTSNEFWVPWTQSAISTVKLLIKFINEAGGLNELQGRVKRFQERNDLRLKSDWCKAQTLESILTLNSNIKNVSDDKIKAVTAIAIHILFHLATITDFFGTRYKRDRLSDKDIILTMSTRKDVQFVGGLFIKLFFTIVYQNITAKNRGRTLIHRKTALKGLLLPSMIKMITYSCYFNAMLEYIGEHMIVRSVAPIKNGEDILLTRTDWASHPKEQRLSELKEEWGTDGCSCRACVENWPLFEKLKTCLERAKSPMSKTVLQIISEKICLLFKKSVNKEEIKDYDKTLDILNNMMKVIYREVNLPCLEQALLLDVLAWLFNY